MALMEGQFDIAAGERIALFAGAAAFAGHLALTTQAEIAVDFGSFGDKLSQRETFISVMPPGTDPLETCTTLMALGYGATPRYLASAEALAAATENPLSAAKGEPPALTVVRSLFHASVAQLGDGMRLNLEDLQAQDVPGLGDRRPLVNSAGLVPAIAQLVQRLSLGTLESLKRHRRPESWIAADIRSDTGSVRRQATEGGDGRLFFEELDELGVRRRFNMTFVPVGNRDSDEPQLCHVAAEVSVSRPGTSTEPTREVRDVLTQKGSELVIVRSRLVDGHRVRGRPPQAPASAKTLVEMASAAVRGANLPGEVRGWGV